MPLASKVACFPRLTWGWLRPARIRSFKVTLQSDMQLPYHRAARP